MAPESQNYSIEHLRVAASQEGREEEQSLEVLGQQVDKIVQKADQEIGEKFEDKGEGGEHEALPFHDREHSEGVRKRTQEIMEMFQGLGLANERDLMLAKLAASAHDVVQLWKVNAIDGKQMRQRLSGKNEQHSVQWAQEQMETIGGFTSEDFVKVEEAILATIAPFDLNYGTCVQKNLSKDSSPIAFAVAWGDLGEAGMDTAAYLEGGKTLFREDNLDMLGINPHKQEGESEEGYQERTKPMRDRILGWIKFQPGFAAGRKQVMRNEITLLPHEIQQQANETILGKIDNTILEAKQRAEDWENKSFAELYELMGYSLPS